MISAQDVYKRYRSDRGAGPWVIKGATFSVPSGVNVGLLGHKGSGKTTLLRLISGVDVPTRGTINNDCRVSWPLGRAGGLQNKLTGRQNAKFVCRIHGIEDDLEDKVEWIGAFADLGRFFDQPVKNYPDHLRARLNLATSLAFDFDVYLADGLLSAGDAAFRHKARELFRQKTDAATMILVAQQESILREFCTAGMWLNRGKVYWFDDIDDALKYHASAPANPERRSNRHD